jgi:hypothetical protein
MANTYKILAQNVLVANAASVTFSSIPSGYKDLILWTSARTDYNNSDDNLVISINGNTTVGNYYLVGISFASGVAYPQGNSRNWIKTSGNSVANAFGINELYIGNYAATTGTKRVGTQGAPGGKESSRSHLASALSFSSSAAITSISLTPQSGTNILTGSSFYLYGIANS